MPRPRSLSRNARPATTFFGLPPNRVVELGMQVQLWTRARFRIRFRARMMAYTD